MRFCKLPYRLLYDAVVYCTYKEKEVNVEIGDIISYDNYLFGIITEINLQKEFVIVKWFNNIAYEMVGKKLILCEFGNFWKKVS